jgi:hypothetical protein
VTAEHYSPSVGGDPVGGDDPVVKVIENLLRLAQEAAMAEDWDGVIDRALRVLHSEAASEDAKRTARQLLGLAEVDSTSPRRVGGSATQTVLNAGIAGGRPSERPRTSERPALEPLPTQWSDVSKSSLNVPKSMLRLFYSYVDADAAYRQKLRNAIAGFRHSPAFDIKEWDREMVGYGENENEVAQRELGRANIILLLISPDYLQQADANDAEVALALLRHRDGDAKVVPIMLKPTVLGDEDLLKTVKGLKPLPPDGIAVTNWPNEDQAFYKIAEGIKQLCDDLASERSTSRLSAIESAGKTWG